MAIYTGRNEDSSGNILLSIGNGMTATLETGSTASQAYTKGAFVFFDNKLCRATAAIASGATLAIGTNLAQTSIGAELTSHLRSSDAKEFYFDVKDGKYGFYPSASKVASEFVPFGGTADSLDVYLYPWYVQDVYGNTAQPTLILPLSFLNNLGYTKYKLVSASSMGSCSVDYPTTPAYGYGTLGSCTVGVEYTIDYTNPNNFFRFFAICSKGVNFANCHLSFY